MGGGGGTYQAANPRRRPGNDDANESQAQMSSITELSIADLRGAGDATETLIDFRAYLPIGETLIMLAGRWRDDIREELGVRPVGRAYRGSEVEPLSEMEEEDFDNLCQAVAVLLSRFTAVMDDPDLPKLLRELKNSLDTQKAERAELPASIGPS